MKKKQIILIFFIIICNSIYGQTKLTEIISTTGFYFEDNTNSLSFTIGEPIITTLTANDLILTQGFQQSKYEITPVIDILGNDISIKVYPNPASQFIIVDMGENFSEQYFLDIVNTKGERLLIKPIVNKETIINLSKYSISEMILRIVNSKKILVKSFKILKIQ